MKIEEFIALAESFQQCCGLQTVVPDFDDPTFDEEEFFDTEFDRMFWSNENNPYNVVLTLYIKLLINLIAEGEVKCSLSKDKMDKLPLHSKYRYAATNMWFEDALEHLSVSVLEAYGYTCRSVYLPYLFEVAEMWDAVERGISKAEPTTFRAAVKAYRILEGISNKELEGFEELAQQFDTLELVNYYGRKRVSIEDKRKFMRFFLKAQFGVPEGSIGINILDRLCTMEVEYNNFLDGSQYWFCNKRLGDALRETNDKALRDMVSQLTNLNIFDLYDTSYADFAWDDDCELVEDGLMFTFTPTQARDFSGYTYDIGFGAMNICRLMTVVLINRRLEELGY